MFFALSRMIYSHNSKKYFSWIFTAWITFFIIQSFWLYFIYVFTHLHSSHQKLSASLFEKQIDGLPAMIYNSTERMKNAQ